ncbi:MAG TPA: extracellular solute-binding protein [Phototrophicaceae bacterium]|nr:extracellular solute-binding protein [Phototrophicaceae bacterium]
MSRKLTFILTLVVLLVAFTAVQAQDPITLKFWHTYNETSPENTMLVETLIPSFEAANPGIKVQSVPFPYNEFRQTMLTALAGEEGPDLARLDIIWSPEFADLGVLANLNEVMPDFQEYADAVFPGPLSTNGYQGSYYGLPLDTNTRVWLYGQDVYEQAGIAEAPKTMADLKAQCEKVQALGDEYFAFSDGGTYGWAVLPWIWSFGGDLTDADMTTATGYLNGEKTVAAYEFLKEMVDSKCFSDGMVGSGFDSGANYFTNKVGAILDGPWMFPIAEAQYPDFEIQTALMPAGDGGSISVVGGENIVVFANSVQDENRAAAALQFLRFTQSDEYQLKMSETGQLTVKPALLETEYYQNHPYYSIFLEQLNTARARLPHPAWTSIEEVLTDAGQLILRGEGSAQEVLDMAAEEIDALLTE